MERFQLQHRGKYIAFDFMAVPGFLAVTILLLRIVHGDFGRDFAISGLLGLLGGVLGAFTSLVITPFSAEERSQWSNVRSVLTGVVAGYGLSVLKDSVNYLFKDGHAFTDASIGIRAIVFLSYFAFAMIYGFSYRRYYVGIDLRMPSAHDRDISENTETSDRVAETPRTTTRAHERKDSE
jgi:drug/metabolite transporter (DMT)-like permease